MPRGPEHRFDFTFTVYSDPTVSDPYVVSGFSRTEGVRLKADTTYGQFSYGELLAQLREVHARGSLELPPPRL